MLQSIEGHRGFHRLLLGFLEDGREVVVECLFARRDGLVVREEHPQPLLDGLSRILVFFLLFTFSPLGPRFGDDLVPLRPFDLAVVLAVS